MQSLIKANQFAENKLAAGEFNFSWFKSLSMNSGSTPVLVKLIIKAKTDLRLIDQISLLRTKLLAETYLEDGRIGEIKLQFDLSPTSVNYEKRMVLNQNIPNPFGQSTTIRFALPQDGEVRWTFMDLTGRTLKTWSQHYSKGSHEIDLHKNEFNTSGVVYYRLDYHGYSEVRKMILMK